MSNMNLAELNKSNAPAPVSMGFGSIEGYKQLKQLAVDFASSDLIPKAFQGKPVNCMIALNMAVRLDADPLMVMQNLYVVHGNPSWSSKFLIATFNQCGKFSALRYEFTGTQGQDDFGCRAYATEKATGEKIQSALVTIALAKAEGWYGKSGSKWQTMPEQMLMYRSASWLIKTHAPELSMGLQTSEEAQDAIELQADKDGVFTQIEDVNKPQEAPEPTKPPKKEKPTKPEPVEVEAVEPEIVNEDAHNYTEAQKHAMDAVGFSGITPPKNYGEAHQWSDEQCAMIVSMANKAIKDANQAE